MGSRYTHVERIVDFAGNIRALWPIYPNVYFAINLGYKKSYSRLTGAGGDKN